MKRPVRIYPVRIQDKLVLSRLLEQYLNLLENSPLQVRLKALAYDACIPECIFRRMINLQYDPADAPNIEVSDYHIIFANIMFRFPTIKIWKGDQGIFFEI